MIDFSDLNDLIDDFSNTSLLVQTKTSSGQFDDAGEWQPDTISRIKIVEPLVPSLQQAKFDYEDGGMVSLYDATWYSHHDEFKNGDTVIDTRTNTAYTIANKTDYSDYANVIEYGLKAVKK